MSNNIKAELRARIASLEAKPTRSTLQAEIRSSKTRQQRLAVSTSRADNYSFSNNSSQPDNSFEEETEEASCVFKRIVRLSLKHEVGSVSLHMRLLKEGYTEKAINSALRRALTCGLVDDQRFADVLIRSRLAQGKGRVGIEAELERHEINLASLAGWPEEFFTTEEDEFNRALSLLEKRPPRAKNYREAAFRCLIRKGYGSEIAAQAACRWSDTKAS